MPGRCSRSRRSSAGWSPRALRCSKACCRASHRRIGATGTPLSEVDAMCLGIPGRVVELVDPDNGIAKADVNGVKRNVSVQLLQGDGGVAVGDWVLIHV